MFFSRSPNKSTHRAAILATCNSFVSFLSLEPTNFIIVTHITFAYKSYHDSMYLFFVPCIWLSCF